MRFCGNHKNLIHGHTNTCGMNLQMAMRIWIDVDSDALDLVAHSDAVVDGKRVREPESC